MIDPYQILGVRSNATGPQLKKTLHRLAHDCPPSSLTRYIGPMDLKPVMH